MSVSGVAIIQARMSSTRLPGKVLMPLAGKPMIWHIVQRAKQCQQVHAVVVATSQEASDDPLAEYCASEDITCYRGELDNVLSRFIGVLQAHPADYCVRITGDCPLICPEFIDFQLQAVDQYKVDSVRLDKDCTILEGQGVHSAASLYRVFHESRHPDDLEHVGSRFFKENIQEFSSLGICIPKFYHTVKQRLTVDEPADYDFMSAVYDELWDGQNIIEFNKVIDFIAQRPDLAAKNANVEHSLINQEMALLNQQVNADVKVWKEWPGLL